MFKTRDVNIVDEATEELRRISSRIRPFLLSEDLFLVFRPVKELDDHTLNKIFDIFFQFQVSNREGRPRKIRLAYGRKKNSEKVGNGREIVFKVFKIVEPNIEDIIFLLKVEVDKHEQKFKKQYYFAYKKDLEQFLERESL
jgi:hypothetical protein